MQTRTNPVDLSKYADVRILNMSNEACVPAGFVILGVYPGQYLMVVTNTLRNHLLPPHNDGGYVMPQEVVDTHTVNMPLQTSFMLIGRPADSVVADQAETIAQLRQANQTALYAASVAETARKDALKAVDDIRAVHASDVEAWRVRREQWHPTEQLATSLRNDIAKLTQHFGAAAVKQVLAGEA